jgi:dCTP diphosphatase
VRGLFGYSWKMKNIDLEKLSEEISTFTQERDWDQFHSIKNLSMALSVETSELLEIFQWMSEDQSNEVKTNPEAMEKIQDEVADIFVYLLRVVNKTGIDLEVAVKNKMAKNALKYPVSLSKGNSKKYTDLK